jgi:hypothetical protein
MYSTTLRKAEQIRRFTITETPTVGWEVREEANSQLVRRDVYTDWHRVERAQMRVKEAIDSLVDDGWVAFA